jgi:hypothetical protein
MINLPESKSGESGAAIWGLKACLIFYWQAAFYSVL